MEPTRHSATDAVGVPFCGVCRRSSDLKWRKHVFSKSHQQAAGEFLAVRVARFEEIVAQLSRVEAYPPPTDKLFCVFCDTNIATLELWIEHYGSTGHRQCLDSFCKTNRCDAMQDVRPKLCIPEHQVQQLLKNLGMKRQAAVIESNRAATVLESILERLKNGEIGAVSNEPSNASHAKQTDVHRPTSTRSGATDMVFGAGLSSISRKNWSNGVANIHSSAVPPWMVDTEEEYTKLNRLARDTAQTTARHKRARPGSFEQERDVTSRLNASYNEKTWLPNFGSVWQEGPRSITKNDFSKRQQTSPNKSSGDTELARRSQILRRTEARLIPGSKSLAAGDSTVARESFSSSIVDRTSSPPTPVEPTELEVKTQHLMAQKERLRAKMAAKRKAPS